jgi:hypothetical protein
MVKPESAAAIPTRRVWAGEPSPGRHRRIASLAHGARAALHSDVGAGKFKTHRKIMGQRGLQGKSRKT